MMIGLRLYKSLSYKLKENIFWVTRITHFLTHHFLSLRSPQPLFFNGYNLQRKVGLLASTSKINSIGISVKF